MIHKKVASQLDGVYDNLHEHFKVKVFLSMRGEDLMWEE